MELSTSDLGWHRLGVLMTAANAYLGLYAGMTVSASIPAAVMSMIILRSFFKDVRFWKTTLCKPWHQRVSPLLLALFSPYQPRL